MLIQLLFTNPTFFLIVTVAIFLAMSTHEYSHAWTAYFLGDSTAKDQGRLTINPFAHLDPIGTLLLFIVGFGWGKPVPINPANLKNQKWGEILIGLSGPASNFFIAIVVGLLLRFFNLNNPALLVSLSIFIWFNLILGVFNLIPIPPLDGSHIFLILAPERVKNFFIKNSSFITIAIILFFYFLGFSFIIEPLFSLITGKPLPF